VRERRSSLHTCLWPERLAMAPSPKAGPSASGGLSVFAASWSAAQLLIDMNAHEREAEILDGHS